MGINVQSFLGSQKAPAVRPGLWVGYRCFSARSASSSFVSSITQRSSFSISWTQGRRGSRQACTNRFAGSGLTRDTLHDYHGVFFRYPRNALLGFHLVDDVNVLPIKDGSGDRCALGEF